MCDSVSKHFRSTCCHSEQDRAPLESDVEAQGAVLRSLQVVVSALGKTNRIIASKLGGFPRSGTHELQLEW